MHEKRNFVLVLLGTACLLWAIWAWAMSGHDGLTFSKIISPLLTIAIAGCLIYAFNMEDRLPDRLQEIVGPHYFEADGVSLFPTVRAASNGPELSIYYQNRYENPASVIVHLRPARDSFTVVQGASDVHIAFRVGGGDVGVLHQPISIPESLKGEIVNVQMVGVSHYPRSHGARWRRHEGMPCGNINVDWVGNAMKIGAHEVDGTVELTQPVTLRLSMPKNIEFNDPRETSYRQEIF
ncbi:MAG: hypothetical protein QF444_03430 [Phycisphaerales bacterium]|jgi:hypothetical protein|nr:hypothetical protein [Phycisphaerales bacterium]MDP6693355.1 hypothetical protein [Phycisphaerales bacterium]